MNVVLFDNEQTWNNLLPLTFTRPISEIRFGILSISQKWEKVYACKVSFLCNEYLQTKYKLHLTDNNLFVNASVCPNDLLIEAIAKIQVGEALYAGEKLIAYKHSKILQSFESLIKHEFGPEIIDINTPSDIFTKNDAAIKADFSLLTNQQKSEVLDPSVTVIGDKNLIFLEKGAKAQACILNTQSGPIYLAADSEIMEGSVVRGPFALGEHSVLKMAAKVYGATTIGPHCKVGGEVNNSVIFGYSNKAHDGFLGNSVIGEWCNLGADTNNSNLKNNYSNVKLYNYPAKKALDTGLQFCGLIMADYSKSGINTMFNTGTVVGVGCNIFGGGFPPTYIPSFSWGGSEGFETYQNQKLFETNAKVFERRGMQFGEIEKNILLSIQKMK